MSVHRELYYENKDLFDSDSDLDRNLRDVCKLLNTPQWTLNILSTSKGLIAGPLKITLASGEVVNCDTTGNTVQLRMCE